MGVCVCVCACVRVCMCLCEKVALEMHMDPTNNVQVLICKRPGVTRPASNRVALAPFLVRKANCVPKAVRYNPDCRGVEGQQGL